VPTFFSTKIIISWSESLLFSFSIISWSQSILFFLSGGRGRPVPTGRGRILWPLWDIQFKKWGVFLLIQYKNKGVWKSDMIWLGCISVKQLFRNGLTVLYNIFAGRLCHHYRYRCQKKNKCKRPFFTAVNLGGCPCGTVCCRPRE
jgi:hypothetical protein